MSKRWLLYMAFGIAIFIAVTYAIFAYWDIGDGNRWSTFFSFASAFGILATIGVYFQQKVDKKNDDLKIIHSYLMDVDAERDKLHKNVSNLILLRTKINSNKYQKLKIKKTNNIFTFVLYKINNEFNQYESHHFHMSENTEKNLNTIYIKLLEINLSSAVKIKPVRDGYSQLFTRLNHISSNHNPSTPKHDYIADMEGFAKDNVLSVDYLLDEISKKIINE